MSACVTAVMYHYVRPVRLSRYPGIKGLETADFDSQLDHIEEAYNPVTFTQVIAAWQSDAKLPPDSVLLTFDDGYADHYHHVLPRLVDRGISGAFFVPFAPVLERKMLDVNKIHFLLATSPDQSALATMLANAIERHAGEPGMLPLAEYRRLYHIVDRFDSADVVFIKRVLQRALPQPLRSGFVDELFREQVTTDEAGFAEELYLSVGQLKTMVAAGMHVGSHTHSHPWLSSLPPESQRNEIVKSLDLFDALGVARDGFTFCYPYGDYNADTLSILKDLGCAAAVTAHPGLARQERYSRYELPRYDTNDLPPRSAPLVHAKH